MKTFQQFQEEMNKKVPPVKGLGGGGGGTDSITDTSPAKSLKKRVIDAGKMATVPARFLLNIKSKPDPTEKFADSRMTPKEKVTSAISDYKRKQKKINEGVASLALKGGVKFLPKVLPKIPDAVKALTSGAFTGLTMLQIKNRVPKDKSKTADIAREKGLDLTNPRQRIKAASLANKRNKPNKTIKQINPETGKVIKPRYDTKLKGIQIQPKKGEVEKTEKLIKQRELLKNKEKEITKPRTDEKKDASKTLKDYLKARKKEGETMYKLKQDAEIADKGPGDLLPDAKKTYLKKLLSNLKNKKTNK